MLTRRTVIVTLGLAPAVTMLPRAAFADYPEKPIHLIVPFAAGGNADIVGRIVGDLISRALKQPVVVENRAGAGGGVGAEVVAHAKPDGYTLLVGSNGPMTINPLINKNVGYDPLKDLAPIALTSYVPHALLMSNKSGVKTIAEFIAASKKNSVNVATSGVGSASHMTLERFKAATGANITHIPYRGGGSLIPDVIGGNVDGAMTEFSTALQVHKSNDARLIGIASKHRSDLATDVPTFIESGVKDFTAQSYNGVLAPAQTPAAIIDQLQKAIAAGLHDKVATDRLRGLGSEIATAEQMTAAGFGKFIQGDAADMRAAANLAGIKPE
jgi:tripartite-type tricarboxylate transporter receptor subunit TctC